MMSSKTAGRGSIGRLLLAGSITVRAALWWALGVLTVLSVSVAPAHAWLVERASIGNSGEQTAKYENSGGLGITSVSNDGRFVCFPSQGSALTPDDTNAKRDIFVRDRKLGTTVRVNVGSQGEQITDYNSYDAVISGDGRFVVFGSQTSSLIAGTTPYEENIYRKDLATGELTLLTKGYDGSAANDSSAWNSYMDVSFDGRYVVFPSFARNLVANDTNAKTDIFLHDCDSHATIMVSRAPDGALPNNSSNNPAISGDGRYVVFVSTATNLVAGVTTTVQQVYLYDRDTQTTALISVGASGGAADKVCEFPQLSRDGRYVVFASAATNLASEVAVGNTITHVYLRDVTSGTTTLISKNAEDAPGDDDSYGYGAPLKISPDGMFVLFSSQAQNLLSETVAINASWNVFVYDQKRKTIDVVNRTTSGAAPNSYSFASDISENGSVVVFTASASNLISGDTNNADDVFTAVSTTDAWSIGPKGTIGGWRNDLVVSGAIAYVAEGTGVSLYDISGETIVKRSRVAMPIEPTMIAVSGNFLYAVGYVPMEQNAWFFAADISNPAAPALLGSCEVSRPSWNGGMAASGNYVYFSSQIGDSWPSVGAIGVVDASNPAAPVARGNIPLGDGVSADAFAVSGSRLYVQGKTTAPMFFVYSLANPLTPVKLGELAVGSSEQSKGLFAAGGLVYSAVGKTGVRVVSVEGDSPSPRHLFTVTVGATTYDAQDVHVSGDLLYAACPDGGVFVYGISDPEHPAYKGLADVSNVRRVSGSSGLIAALAGEGDAAIRKIVFSGEAPMAGAGTASPLWASGGVLLDGNRLYLGADGLFIYDASNPAIPTVLSNDCRWSNLVPLAVSGNTLFGLTPPSGEWSSKVLSAVNVGDPAKPSPLGAYTASGSLAGGVVSGTRAYLLLSGAGTGAEIIDVSNPAGMAKAGTIPFPSYSDGNQDSIAADGNLACIGGYTLDGGNRVHVFDVTSAASPVLKASLPTPGRDIRLWLKGASLLVSSNTYLTEIPENVIEAYDLIDPAAPVRIGQVRTQKAANDMKVLGQEGQDLLIALAKPGGSVHTVGYTPATGGFYPGPVCPSPYSYQVTVSQTPNSSGGYTVVTSDASFGTYTQEIMRTPTTCCLTTEVSPAQAAAEGCTAAPAKVDPVDCGGQVDVTATAKEPWYFKEWTGAATGVSPSTQATATGRCSIAVANFVKPTLTLTAGAQNPNAYAEFYGLAGEFDYANGRTNVPIAHIVLTANEVDDWLATKLTFTTSGTGNEKEDVAEARLYLGSIGGTLLGTQTFSDDNANLSFSFTVNIPKSSSVSMILVYDFKPERAFPCNNYGAKLDMAHVTAIPENYPPGQKLPMPPLGVMGGPSAIKRGDVVIDDGDRQYGQPEDQQHPNPPPLEKKLKTRLKWQHPATVEWIEYEISSPTAWGGFLEGVRGQREVHQPVNAEGYAEASMTLGTAKGHDNPYNVVVDQKNRGAACTSSYARSVFTEWGMGVELPTNARYDGTADGGEDGFGTFLNMIQMENDFIATVEMAPENFATIKEVNFQLGSLLYAQGTLVGLNQYKATFDLKHFNGPTPLKVTCVMNRNGEEITAEEIYNVKIIPLPSWVNAVGNICDESSFVKEFVGEDEAYKLTFNYPTNFAWSDYVPGDVGMLGGLNNNLDIEFSAEALYRIDETSTFGATVKGKPTILGKEFDLEGGLSGDFDPNFAFQRGTGNLRASFGFDLPEKGYSKTFLVYGVPITAAVDLSGNVEIFVRGAAVLNRQLEFEEITVAPGTTVTGNITISLSAVFGLAKISATGSPSVTLEIEMKYTSANGTNTTWRGEVVVPITVVGSIFWGVGSAELCSVTLGPWTFGSGAAPTAFRSPMGTGAAAPRFLSSQSLAVDAAGRRMLVWTDDAAPDHSSPNAELFYRYHDGTDWGVKAPITGSTTPNAEWETDPAAVFMGNGAALACWTANKGAPTLNNLNEILAAQDIACSAWSGTAWGAPVKIIDDAEADGTATIAYDAINQKAVAVWVHNADPGKDAMKRTSWNLKYAAFDAVSGLWTQAADVPGTDTGADMMPAVAVDGSGVPVLVWARDDDGIYYTENEKGANDEPVVKNGTTIASADNLDSRILWSKWTGSSWSAPAAVASGDKATRLAPAIAPSPGGKALAVWTEKEPGKKNSIKYAVFDASAGSWTTPGLVVESSSFLEEPEAVVDASGKATVIWKGYARGGGALFSSTGQMGAPIIWSDPKQITANDAIQWQPVAVVDKDNKILTSWSEYDSATGKPVTSGGFGSAGNVVDPNPGSATLAGTYADWGVDANSDGLFEAVEVSVDATIILAGNYEVRGKLFKDGKFLVGAASVRDGLSAGKQTFSLLFPGAVLGDRGAGGPYQLKDVVLIDRNGTPVRVENVAAPYATIGTYDPSKFVPGPLKLDKTRYVGSGAQAVVTLTDTVRNTNSETLQMVAVRVVSALDPVGFPLTLTETGPATGVFTGTVGFSLTATNSDQKNIRVGDHALLQVIHDDAALDYRWVAAAPWVIGGSGDINGDGKIDMADAILSLQVITRSVQAGAVIMKAADVGGNETISADDALYILQKNAGLR